MNDIEKKALALLNECGWGGAHLKRTWNPRYEALCRAIEQHEAFRQEVSDAVSGFFADDGFDRTGLLRRFIIAKPDPLEEALRDAACDLSTDDFAEALRASIKKRGGKIVWGEG